MELRPCCGHSKVLGPLEIVGQDPPAALRLTTNTKPNIDLESTGLDNSSMGLRLRKLQKPEQKLAALQYECWFNDLEALPIYRIRIPTAARNSDGKLPRSMNFGILSIRCYSLACHS